MKKFSEVSNDIDNKELEIEVEKLEEPIEIESIIDIFVEPEENSTNENLIALNTDLSNKEVKRGDIVYITAFIKKPGHSMTSPSTQSILKLRVVDIYQGLSQLNRLIK